MTKFRKRLVGLAALVAVFFLSAAAGWGAINPKTEQKIVAGKAYFGSSVSISGNTALIGDISDDGNSSGSGAAYVFIRNSAGKWIQQDKIFAADGAGWDGFGNSDRFGNSVALDGDTAVVGASGANNYEGAVYVFSRNESGVWVQQAKLLIAEESHFGSSVSVSGDTIVIGTYYSGSAYVFARNTLGDWNLQAKLSAEDGEDSFGWSVSVYDDTVAVGAFQDYVGNLGGIGSVYVFVRNETDTWRQQAILLAEDADAFGYSVSLSEETAVIGAPDVDEIGAVYIFTRSGDSWTQHSKLQSQSVATSQEFGYSVAVSGDVAVIGESDTYGFGFGSAYVFSKDTTGYWNEQVKLAPQDASYGDRFASSVSISNNNIMIGAVEDDEKGAVYCYSSAQTTSDVTVTVTAPTGGSTYNHGSQVTINWETENTDPGDTMVLSMKRDAASTMAAPDDGSWYRFTENTPNDGTETVTIPDSVVVASDWRFYVRHVASNAYDAADATVTLEEPTNTHKLYVTKTGEGSGAITSSPGNLSCGDACKNTNVLFASGETVVLTATPSNCSKLVGWEGCDSFNLSDNTCTVTMNEYREVTAQFAPETNTGTLRVLFDRVPYEAGYVTSDPLGIVAANTDISAEHKFCVGDTVRLTAQASVYPRTVFNGWTITNTPNNPCNGDQNADVCDVTITNGMTEIRPAFLLDTTQPYNLHVRVSGHGKGHVTSQWRNLNCGNDGTGTTCDIWLNSGDQDILSAVAAPGSKFVRWSGIGSLDCNGKTDQDCPYTMIWPHEVEAVFSAEDLGVSVSASVDALVSGIDTSFKVLISNNTDEDSHQTTIDINTLVNDQPYDQLAWQCGDNTGKGTCQKIDQDTFQIMVKGGESIVITASSAFTSVQKKVTISADLTNDYDANIYNNHSKKDIQLDPDLLNSVANRTLLKFHSGQSSDASTRNTIVFTHGWQPFKTGGCETRKGTDRLECYGKELWTGNKAFQQGAWLARRNRVTDFNSPNTITDPLNVIQYVWKGAFTGGIYSSNGMYDFITARNNIFTAGNMLGKYLASALTNGYTKKIHLIGHSMGTAVNAHAVRYLLDNVPTFRDQSSYAQIQMTILDHPNRISRVLWMSDDDEKQYGFDEDWFAELLPEVNQPEYREKLLVDNYFAEEKTVDSKFETAGVGTPITGVNVYNHKTITKKGLHDPNDMGDTLFTSETNKVLPSWIADISPSMAGLYILADDNNDHTGVHQWYRWTMWPSRKDGLTDNSFVCSNRVWSEADQGVEDSPSHISLDPCESGFAFSILQDSPVEIPRNGTEHKERRPATAITTEGTTTGKDCTMDLQDISSCSGALQEAAQLLRAEEFALASAETIDTAASYGATEINLSHAVDRISFEYQFNNNVEGEYVHLLLDGRIVWSLDEVAAENGVWEQTGKIPVALERGKHHLMLVYNQQTDTSSFEMRELQFFEAPNTNGFLPAMLLLLLNNK